MLDLDDFLPLSAALFGLVVGATLAGLVYRGALNNQPVAAIYEPITGKLAAADKEPWRLKTSRGDVIVPYSVFAEHSIGDKRTLRIGHDGKVACAEGACEESNQ